MQIDRWRPVVGYEGMYEISDTGRVRSLDRVLSDGRRWKAREINPKPSGGGHLHVRLCADAHKWLFVHRLVLEAFVGPCPEGMECAHNNGDPSDNSLANLRWDTRKGNHADKVRHGTMVRGERSPRARLTEDNVREIFRLRRNGALLSEIAGMFSVTPANICAIVTGKTWRHLGESLRSQS